MGAEDKALRGSAIPYYANVWGYNHTSTSDIAITSADGTGNSSDLGTFQPTYGSPSTVNAIRVLQPQYGDIIEANLNLKFKLATAEGARKFRVAIGYFSSRYTAETSYDETYITNSHRKLTGRDLPFDIAPASTFNIQRLNLYPGMYHRGNALFKDDAFVVLLCFDSAISVGSGYSFTRFEVDCTMQMGLS